MAANGFRLHAQYLHHRGTLSAIENGQCRLAHAPAEDAPFLEVLGENQPKNRVVLIRRICRGGLLGSTNPTALIAHTNFADRNQEIHFLKNTAMMGGFLYITAFGARAWSLDAWWSRRGVAAAG